MVVMAVTGRASEGSVGAPRHWLPHSGDTEDWTVVKETLLGDVRTLLLMRGWGPRVRMLGSFLSRGVSDLAKLHS